MSARVETLRRSDARECARVLARAFLDNPATLALIPGASARRLRVLERVMRGFTEATLIAGKAFVVRDQGRIGGVMLDYEPRAYPPPVSAYAWLSYGPVSAGPRVAFRYALADAYLRRIHPRFPHFYLFVLGVDPELQGRGLGSRLLQSLGAAADAERLPCYLETDKSSSVRLYERHGFRVERDETEPRLGVRFWTMSRAASVKEARS